MPFLRFSRDRRGYANTYLCHTFRQGGVVRMRVLYWFRTPPDIGVGRPALDAAAMRDIEASNPDLTFDWDEIMKAEPLAPPARPAGERLPGRRRGRGGRTSAAPVATPPSASQPAAGTGAADAASSARAGAADTASAGAEPAAGGNANNEGAAPRRRRRRRRRGARTGDDRAAPAEPGPDGA